jgi:hypothetical protein
MKPRKRKPKPRILPAIPAGTGKAVNAAVSGAKPAVFVRIVGHNIIIDEDGDLRYNIVLWIKSCWKF